MATNRKILSLAKKIKLIAMDVDGVLTGGEIIVLNSGEEVKFWSVKDRFGFHLVHRCKADIRFAWITGRESRQVADRAKECGIDELHQNCMSKRQAMEEILRKYGLKPEEAAFIGDDLVDIPVLRFVGLGVAPADAVPEVLKEADFVTSRAGGKGVLREVVDIVLQSQGLWKNAANGYL